jgi:hypothetical protein
MSSSRTDAIFRKEIDHIPISAAPPGASPRAMQHGNPMERVLSLNALQLLSRRDFREKDFRCESAEAEDHCSRAVSDLDMLAVAVAHRLILVV